MYTGEIELNEVNVEQYKDGNIYGIVPAENGQILSRLSTTTEISTEYLDTLGLIPEEDTALLYQSLTEAGATEEMLARFRICLFKRPSGFVRYQDNQLPNSSGGLGKLEPVRGMQVWALFFGIPFKSYTDANGHYSIPWRFSAGTLMGTHAKNSRVTIKPFNTKGNFFQVVPQLIVNFIVGSVHVRSLVSSCDMKDDVNFNFTGHTQVRYWSQLLNAYYYHDLYAAQDGILSAPQNNMICYAHWADGNDFGNASTPMLYHLTGATYTDQFINWMFGNNVTGTLLNVIHGLLPDMTIRINGNNEPAHYSPRLAQTAFHELAHASVRD
jgi:hypothetical protein